MNVLIVCICTKFAPKEFATSLADNIECHLYFNANVFGDFRFGFVL